MYAMTGKLLAQKGRRAELIEILKQAANLVGEIPQCRIYLVNEDLSNETYVWIYELWDDRESHDASLDNAQIRALIAHAKPLLACAPDGAELKAVGGHAVDLEVAGSMQGVLFSQSA